MGGGFGGIGGGLGGGGLGGGGFGNFGIDFNGLLNVGNIYGPVSVPLKAPRSL